MPSPIAHSVSGYLISKLPIKTNKSWRSHKIIRLLFVVLVANAADFDFIPQIITGEKYHHGLTHSITFSLIFSLVSGLIAYWYNKRLAIPIFIFVLSLYSSHLFLDFFTSGGDGIELFWPFNNICVKSSWEIFPPVRWSEGILDYSHFYFIGFELIYAVLLYGMWHLSSNKIHKRDRVN